MKARAVPERKFAKLQINHLAPSLVFVFANSAVTAAIGEGELMRIDDDLNFAEELKAKYAREEIRAHAVAAANPDSEEARTEERRKLMADRAVELGDVESKLARRVSSTWEARMVAGIQIFLAVFLLLLAGFTRFRTSTEISSYPGVRTGFIVAGEGVVGSPREIDQNLGMHHYFELTEWIISFSKQAPMPSVFFLAAMGGLRLLLGIGVWIGRKFWYYALGIDSFLETWALLILLIFAGGTLVNAGGQSIFSVLDWGAITGYLVIRALTAYVCIVDAKLADDLMRALEWGL